MRRRAVRTRLYTPPSAMATGTPLRVQFKQGSNPFAEELNKPKRGEGIVSMRRRKVEQRAELKAMAMSAMCHSIRYAPGIFCEFDPVKRSRLMDW